MIKRNGFAQIPLMIALLLMAIAIPVVTKFIDNSRDTRNLAAGNVNQCSKDSDCGTPKECAYCMKSGTTFKCVKGCGGVPTFKPTAGPTSKPGSGGGSTPVPTVHSSGGAGACIKCLDNKCIAWDPTKPRPSDSVCVITPTLGPGGACVCVNGVYVGVGACLGKPCNITPTPPKSVTPVSKPECPVSCKVGICAPGTTSFNDKYACKSSVGVCCLISDKGVTPTAGTCIGNGVATTGASKCCSGYAVGGRCLPNPEPTSGGYGVCACIGGINYGVGVCNGTKCAAPTYVPEPGDYGVCACIGGINYGVGSCRGTACNTPTGTTCKANGASSNSPSSCCSGYAAKSGNSLICSPVPIVTGHSDGGMATPTPGSGNGGGGGGTIPLATPTKTSGGGGGGNDDGGDTGTGSCVEQCPGSDGVLRSCSPPEAGGSSNDSICNSVGRVESCGGANYCCPTVGGTWTTDMTSCPIVVAGTEPVLKFRMAFAGINPVAACALAKDLPLLVVVRNNDGTSKSYTGVIATRVENTTGTLAHYDVTLRLTGFKQTGNFSVFVKGPKQLQVKYGINSQDKYYDKAGGELTGMTSDPATTPVFSFEKYPLLAGDVTGPDNVQDGVVDGRDFVFVKAETIKRTEVASGGYMLADLNGNCKMESQDLSNLMLSLSIKQGQLY